MILHGVATGHGLKDPRAAEHAPVTTRQVKPTLAALRRLIEG